MLPTMSLSTSASPNTPQLRELQQSEQLNTLLSSLQTKNLELQKRSNRAAPMPLLVKLSPDLNTSELEIIVDVVNRLGIDGIIATNTTISRDNLQSPRQEVS